MDWATALTFVHYQVMASPLLFTAFFLAVAPGVYPTLRRARVIFAAVLGVLCAGGQLYVSVTFGPYLALLLVSPLTIALDRWLRPKPLV